MDVAEPEPARHGIAGADVGDTPGIAVDLHRRLERLQAPGRVHRRSCGVPGRFGRHCASGLVHDTDLLCQGTDRFEWPLPLPPPHDGRTPQLHSVSRESLTSKVYDELRTGLMEGRFWPGYRFKVRDLAAAMKVSETPCREALMQLVRERVLVMDAGRSIAAAPLSLSQYLELRGIRLLLEGMAGEAAARHVTPAQMRRIEELSPGPDEGHQRSTTGRPRCAPTGSSTMPSTAPPACPSCWR